MPEDPALAGAQRALEGDGLLARAGGLLRTTRRFQSAMARAGLRLYAAGDRSDDLRTPIAMALLDYYGERLSDEELAERIEAMLPIEQAELGFKR